MDSDRPDPLGLDDLDRAYSAMIAARSALSATEAKFLEAADSFYAAATRARAGSPSAKQPDTDSSTKTESGPMEVHSETGLICWACQKVIAGGVAYSTDEATGRLRHAAGSPLCRPWSAPPAAPAMEAIDRLAAARAKLESVLGELAQAGIEVYLPFKTVGGQESWQQITGASQLELRVTGSQEAPSI